jgi:hypothetical protein
MTIEEARKVWAQRSMEFRQRVKDSGLTADEYCEQERKKVEQAKLTPWQYFKKWLNLD